MQRSSFTLAVLLNIAVTLALLAGGYYALVTGMVPVAPVPSQQTLVRGEGSLKPVAPPATVVEREDAIIETVSRVSPSVVSIVITRDLPKLQPYSPFWFNPVDPLGEAVPDAEPEKQRVGGGSGFFISSDGLILTNKHVVNYRDAEYTVVTSSGEKLPAKVLARDDHNDLAVLKVEGKDFPALPLGDSSKLRIGQSVIAIGYALGEFENTVSVGVVSGLSRTITAGGSGVVEQLEGVIQTDAAINPGNSGGPLLNLAGEVVGINTAVAQSAQSIGFALAINDAKRNVESVQKHGRIIRPYIGVRYMTITEELQKANSLPVAQGVIVLRGETPTALAVVPGSPADKAGIVENDIITKVDGTELTEEQPLWKLISGKNVGDRVALTVLSKGKERTVELTLEEAPAAE